MLGVLCQWFEFIVPVSNEETARQEGSISLANFYENAFIALQYGFQFW